MIQLFEDGGWAMYPILVLLILGITIAIERVYNLSRAAIDAEEFFRQLEEALKQEGLILTLPPHRVGTGIAGQACRDQYVEGYARGTRGIQVAQMTNQIRHIHGVQKERDDLPVMPSGVPEQVYRAL